MTAHRGAAENPPNRFEKIQLEPDPEWNYLTSRLRLLDSIPIQNSLKHDLEIWNLGGHAGGPCVAPGWHVKGFQPARWTHLVRPPTINVEDLSFQRPHDRRTDRRSWWWYPYSWSCPLGRRCCFGWW